MHLVVWGVGAIIAPTTPTPLASWIRHCFKMQIRLQTLIEGKTNRNISIFLITLQIVSNFDSGMPLVRYHIFLSYPS